MNRAQSIETLNSFLRGELTAVASYRAALARVRAPENQAELEACLASHERRVEALRRQVRALGGEPAESAGAFGAFARLLEAGAAAVGDEAAIALLEEGEDRGLQLYLDDVCKLDRETRKQIEREVLPEQVRTHDSLSDLKLALRDT
jgi:demethoxyubiquinone hydroxylase (CLK1/Coq7/Cat5 family)